MNTGWKVAAAMTVALTAFSAWLSWNALTSPPRPSDGDRRSGLQVSSIDLASGMRDVVLSASDMMPGDEVTAAVTVANSGSKTLTYTMRRGLWSTDGLALSTALLVTVRTVGSSCADFDGTVLYDGPLDAAALGGDGSGRPLPAATAEILCFRAMLPRDAGDAAQGATTTVALAFESTAETATP